MNHIGEQVIHGLRFNMILLRTLYTCQDCTSIQVSAVLSLCCVMMSTLAKMAMPSTKIPSRSGPQTAGASTLIFLICGALAGHRSCRERS
jgi:hypothetical protein